MHRTTALAGQCSLQLGLGHLRATPDPSFASLVAKLGVSAASRPRVGAFAAPAAGRDVFDRGPAGLLRLSVASPLLVHGACRDLLRFVLAGAALEQALLDVVVLPFALGAPGSLRHVDTPPRRFSTSVPT